MGAVVDDAGLTLLEGDCRDLLPTLPEASVHCVVTSPPYWGLRDYGTATWEGGDPACDHRGPPQQSRASTLAGNGHGNGKPLSPSLQAQAVPYRTMCGKCGAQRLDAQLGLEATPEAYLAAMVAVFREVRRVLRDDGTFWLNMGDSYAGSWGNQGRTEERGTQRPINGGMLTPVHDGRYPDKGSNTGTPPPGYKPKDLIGMPWRLAFALQADGWYLRADIIWAKPNPMPESVTDRPTKAHEYVFLLTKSARYFYDADAVREPATDTRGSMRMSGRRAVGMGVVASGNERDPALGVRPTARNLRSVWTLPTEPTPEAHFATFPPALASRCIQAGTSEKGCCAACGAPWARQVDADHPGDRSKIVPTYEAFGVLNRRTHPGSHHAAARATTGWTPTCACASPPGAPGAVHSGGEDRPARGAPIPCTVLDPFAGSGTTGQVAQTLGRRAVLIELSPPYVAIARTRTAQRGLFAEPAAR